MSYIEENLTKNEEIIEKATIHWFIYSKSALAFLLAFLFMGSPDSEGIVTFLVFLGILFLCSALVHKYTTELAVTNKRVIAKYGLISRYTIELNLDKIEGLDVNQGIMGRVLNFGNIIIGGTGGKKSPIRYISKPLKFRKTVNEQIEA